MEDGERVALTEPVLATDGSQLRKGEVGIVVGHVEQLNIVSFHIESMDRYAHVPDNLLVKASKLVGRQYGGEV